MTTADWKNPVSGDWATGAAWSPGTIPNKTTAEVTIAVPGTYIVTIGATEHFTADTLTIGSAATLDLAGTLDLAALSGDLLIVHGGVLQAGGVTGGGVIGGGIINDGLIDAAKTTILGTSPSGTGNLAIGSGATLELVLGAAERAVFTGTGATLLIGEPSQFTGTISGFEQTDTIALAGIQATAVTIVGDTLDVLSGSSVVDSLILPADYSAAKFSVVESGNTALISETGITYAVEGETWGSSTVTWSFAATTFAKDAQNSESFSNFVSQTADQAIFEQALQEWTSVTGLTFVQVADTVGTADIRIGWGSFSGSEIGEADFSLQGSTLLPDVLVRLEDPALDPISTTTGTAIYSGTQSSVMQVALHELGHAIGLDHTPDPNAIMNPVSSATNRQLDASDIAGGQALYAGDIACYAAGTRIGDVPIEQLRPGDLVRSALSGDLVPVIWTGHRQVDCRRAQAQPVRVRAHAFADGQPARDLVLSPEHAIACDGVLIPVRCLVDGSAIVRLDVATVTYWHVELPAHDLVWAEGLAAESYIDTGNRACFGEAAAAAEAVRCLELRLDGAAVARARRRLAARAQGITVLADGTLLQPTRARRTSQTYLVPPGVHLLALGGENPLACLLDGRPTVRRHWQLGGNGSILEVFLS